jgi:hypothetical protein
VTANVVHWSQVAGRFMAGEPSERKVLEFTRHEIETLLATGNISYRRVDIRIVDEPNATSESSEP